MSEGNTKVDVLMVGTGEYTTGFVGGGKARSEEAARKEGEKGQRNSVKLDGQKVKRGLSEEEDRFWVVVYHHHHHHY